MPGSKNRSSRSPRRAAVYPVTVTYIQTFSETDVGDDAVRVPRRCRPATLRGPVARLGRRCKLSIKKRMITLSGGSLGSCVDEERSQLRELM
jgi:hypothetical protein